MQAKMMAFTPFSSASTFSGRRLTISHSSSAVRAAAPRQQLVVCRSLEAGVGLFG